MTTAPSPTRNAVVGAMLAPIPWGVVTMMTPWLLRGRGPTWDTGTFALAVGLTVLFGVAWGAGVAATRRLGVAALLGALWGVGMALFAREPLAMAAVGAVVGALLGAGFGAGLIRLMAAMAASQMEADE